MYAKRYNKNSLKRHGETKQNDWEESFSFTKAP